MLGSASDAVSLVEHDSVSVLSDWSMVGSSSVAVFTAVAAVHHDAGTVACRLQNLHISELGYSST